MKTLIIMTFFVFASIQVEAQILHSNHVQTKWIPTTLPYYQPFQLDAEGMISRGTNYTHIDLKNYVNDKKWEDIVWVASAPDNELDLGTKRDFQYMLQSGQNTLNLVYWFTTVNPNWPQKWQTEGRWAHALFVENGSVRNKYKSKLRKIIKNALQANYLGKKFEFINFRVAPQGGFLDKPFNRSVYEDYKQAALELMSIVYNETFGSGVPVLYDVCLECAGTSGYQKEFAKNLWADFSPFIQEGVWVTMSIAYYKWGRLTTAWNEYFKYNPPTVLAMDVYDHTSSSGKKRTIYDGLKEFINEMNRLDLKLPVYINETHSAQTDPNSYYDVQKIRYENHSIPIVGIAQWLNDRNSTTNHFSENIKPIYKYLGGQIIQSGLGCNNKPLCVWLDGIDFGLDKQGLAVMVEDANGNKLSTFFGNELTLDKNRIERYVIKTKKDKITFDLGKIVSPYTADDYLRDGIYVHLFSYASGGWVSNKVFLKK